MLRQPNDDEADALIGDKHPEACAGEGEDERFRKKLADDSKAARSNRGTDGKFMLASRAAGEQENGDIAAANRQEQPDGAEE